MDLSLKAPSDRCNTIIYDVPCVELCRAEVKLKGGEYVALELINVLFSVFWHRIMFLR